MVVAIKRLMNNKHFLLPEKNKKQKKQGFFSELGREKNREIDMNIFKTIKVLEREMSRASLLPLLISQ